MYLHTTQYTDSTGSRGEQSGARTIGDSLREAQISNCI